MLKVEEIRNLGEDEILEKVSQLKKQLMQYRFQSKTGKLERQGVIAETKRDIARLLTVMNEKKEVKS
jgi:large subunit ribosomal protein L29